MRPSDVLRRATTYLEAHGVPSPRSNAERLLLHVLETDRAGLYVRTEGLTSEQARAFGRLLCRRCTGTPAQLLTGETGFRRIVLRVREGVFIPRPETEVVVDVAMEAIRNVASPNVVDVGTGTGAIALAIKDERPDARVVASDHSELAVSLARENADRLALAVDVVHADLFDGFPGGLRGGVHLVVSNPPYVRPNELADLPADVLADPADALVGGLGLTERLLAQANPWLAPGGAVVIEIGEYHADETEKAAVEAGFVDVRVTRDLTGRDRVLSGRRP